MNATERLGNAEVEGLYRRFGPMVLRRCRSLLGDEELAADAMQDTFVQVLRHRATLNTRYPSSLLYRIATNTSLNMLRSKRRKSTVSADPFITSIAGSEDTESRFLDAWELDTLFLGVKESTRKAAHMHYLEQKTLAETAEEVGLSISGVRKRLRALRRLGMERLAG